MSTIDKEQLLKAAKAVRAAQVARALDDETDDRLEQRIRFSPVWATVPNPPAAGEPITEEHLETFLRNCRIAEALGIEC